MEEALHGLVQRAGVIFVGTVTRVERVCATGGSPGIVEIQFAVDTSVRGLAVTGDSYTLREWGGLWAGGDQRFRVGERRLMLLHSPGAGGLGSPVGGMDGALPIHGRGPAVSANDGTVTALEPVVDLRWIGTRTLRAITSATAAPATTSSSPQLARARALTAAGESTVDPGDASTSAQEAGVSTLVNLIASWARESSTDAR